MYNIKGPSKIVAKTTTRRGITQNLENYRDNSRNKLGDKDENEITNVPKPIFNKKCSSQTEQHQDITPQHEEIVNFIYQSWTSVCSELDLDNGDESLTSRTPSSKMKTQKTHYYEDEPCASLQDFKPFDLESWWGRRLYAYITSTANVNS